MLKIIIYKDKITATKWEKNEGIWLEYDIAKEEDHLTAYFNRLVEIKPDVTVEDFMNHLAKYEELIDYCFCGYMNQVPLRLFLNEMEKDSMDTDLGEIELTWEGEVLEEDLAVIGYIRGWLKPEKIEQLGKEHEVPHDIGFLPINIWKNCKFMLNENLIINNIDNLNELNKEVVFYGFYRWTLFEVISNFLGDLSVNGSPDERDILFLHLENKKYNVQEIAKDEKESEFWIGFLETQLIDFKKAKDKALENEEYEAASKLKTEIETTEKELLELKNEIKKNRK